VVVLNPGKRLAFTLIELIFAIVIIGISIMSLPLMNRVASDGVEVSLAQEAIYAASAELMSISSYYWDDLSVSDTTSALSRVIDINKSNSIIRCENNSSSSRYRLRLGHISQPLHRRCLDSNTTTLINGAEGLNAAVVSDKNLSINSSSGTATADASGIKHLYKKTVTVTTNGNIKTIQVDINKSTADKTLVTRMSMQSANIGEIDYFSRRF